MFWFLTGKSSVEIYAPPRWTALCKALTQMPAENAKQHFYKNKNALAKAKAKKRKKLFCKTGEHEIHKTFHSLLLVGTGGNNADRSSADNTEG